MPGSHAFPRHRPHARWNAVGLAWLLLLPMLPAATAAARDPATEYQLDPVHTRVMFAIDHAGFSRAIGTVSGATGTLVFDPDDWTRARLEATVPLERLDLGDEDWNKATRGGAFLDTDRYPTAHFVSTRVEPVDAQRAVVHGTLTLRGVSREVELDVTLNAVKRHPMPPFRRTAGFSATTLLSRADFGITSWKTVVGDEVELRIEAEATRSANAGKEPDARDAQPPAPAVQQEQEQEPAR